MANLDNDQLEILKKYKQDLRRGNLSKLAKDLTSSISKYDRGEIIAYMIEHGIDILSAMSFIPEQGIKDLENLPILMIPGNIETIRKNGIYRNPSVKEILIEHGVQNIDSNAITGNSNLTAIILPPSVTTLGAGAFSNNPNLQEVFISDGIKVLPRGLFEGCNDNIVVKANFRENKADRLRCVEGEKDWYRTHLKWIKD